MLKIEKEQPIEHTGDVIENLTDLAEGIEFMYYQLEQEFGHRFAKKTLVKILIRVLRKVSR